MLEMIAALTVAAAQDAAPRRALSAADQDAVRAVAILSQVYRHWRVDCELPDVVSTVIDIDIILDLEGRIVGEPVLVRPSATTTYRAVSASALRSVRDSTPFAVPAGYQGGRYRARFLPGRVCTPE